MAKAKKTAFARGALPTPRHRLLAATPFVAPPFLMAPTQFAVVPPQLSFWDNNVDGDCVTAEEAFAKAVFSVMTGQPELFIPDAEVIPGPPLTMPSTARFFRISWTRWRSAVSR